MSYKVVVIGLDVCFIVLKTETFGEALDKAQEMIEGGMYNPAAIYIDDGHHHLFSVKTGGTSLKWKGFKEIGEIK